MAPTPGGGRSPTTKPPPSPPRPVGQQRPTRDRRPVSNPRVAAATVVRWAVLLGGLVIIVDLAAKAMGQRSLSPDDQSLITTVDTIANCLLFSALGIIVVRDTGVMYMGAVAGVVAALLDATVVSAASVMAPTGPGGTVEELFVTNLVIGTLFAGVGGLVYAVMQRRSGGRRSR